MDHKLENLVFSRLFVLFLTFLILKLTPANINTRLVVEMQLVFPLLSTFLISRLAEMLSDKPPIVIHVPWDVAQNQL